jgi:hypothetical protein
VSSKGLHEIRITLPPPQALVFLIETTPETGNAATRTFPITSIPRTGTENHLFRMSGRPASGLQPGKRQPPRSCLPPRISNGARLAPVMSRQSRVAALIGPPVSRLLIQAQRMKDLIATSAIRIQSKPLRISAAFKSNRLRTARFSSKRSAVIIGRRPRVTGRISSTLIGSPVIRIWCKPFIFSANPDPNRRIPLQPGETAALFAGRIARTRFLALGTAKAQRCRRRFAAREAYNRDNEFG